MGRLIGIAVKSAHKAPMELLEEALVSTASGVADVACGRPGPRQVTVLSRESWTEACSELGSEVPWTARRANLLVEGLELAETKGARLQVGETLLEITGETAPCGRMDQAARGLREKLEPAWRGGVTCRVLADGIVRVGDGVEMLSD
jgi:MOSC domain-containing protein YiiM